MPPLGQVTGVVTLDGQPVSGATITFEPKFEAHPASGRTDASGRYTLNYKKGVPGAAVGEYSVRILHYGNDPEIPSEGLIPAKYGAESTLTANVKEGDNELNFQLQSK